MVDEMRRVGVASRWRRRWLVGAGVAAAAAALCCAPAGAAVADGRAYELVSPVDKSGGQAGTGQPDLGASYSVASADGETIVYYTSGPIGDGSVRGFQRFHVGRRTATGWTVTPTIAGPVADFVVDPIGNDPQLPTPSRDREHLVFAAQSFGPPHPRVPEFGRSPAGLYRATAGGPLRWISQPTVDDPWPPLDSGFGPGTFSILGGNADLSTAYFAFRGRLTAQDAPRVDRPDSWGLYRWQDGELQTASILPDGTVDPDGSIAIGQRSLTDTGEGFYHQRKPVSADGRRLAFASPAPDPNASPEPIPQLYVRIDGERTVLASRDARTGDPAPTGVTYSALGEVDAHATPDGRYVFFVSEDQLTDDAPADATRKLYRFDVDDETLSYATVSDVLFEVSDDGQRAMVIDEHGDLAIWSAERTWTLGSAPRTGAALAVRTTADGRAWAFTSTWAFDPQAPQVAGTRQIYRYELGDSAPTCVSCPRDGAAPRGGQGVNVWFSAETVHARGVSDDLRQIFFDTEEAFDPRDTNGVRDVYRWKDGELALISTGRDSRPSFFLDNSADGGSVFFTTAEGIDPDDVDESYDVYVARVGGGFPRPPVPRPCAGDECQGPATTWGTSAPPGSVLFTGPGDVPGTEGATAPVFAVQPLTAQQRRRWARHGRVVLRVRVSEPGSVTARVRARIGSRVRPVASATRTASRGGMVRLPLTLSRGARARLRRGDAVRATVVVRYSAADDGPQRARVVLRRARAHGGRAARRGGAPARGADRNNDRREAR